MANDRATCGLSSGVPEPEGGEQFGRYRLLSKIASGGMGEIYLARLEGTGGFTKMVVIKRLLPALVASPEFVTMFLHEARIAAELSHANICDVYELGEVDGRYFIAMQYLQGVPMSRLAAPAQVDPAEHVRLVTGLVVQACDGLQHAHDLTDGAGKARELVHRDISPSNLMVTFDGTVKVLDFGIAQAEGVPSMTSNGSIRGKFAYMSPEQIRGESLDRRTDLFSLGIIAYETLTRRRLFQRPSEFLVAKAILEEDYPVPHEVEPAIPTALSAVLGKALARSRDDRYQQARDLRAAIASAMADHGGPMTPAEIAETLSRRFADDKAEQSEQFERATEQISRSAVAAARSGATDMTSPTRSLRGGAPLLDRVTESAPVADLPVTATSSPRRWPVLLLAGALVMAGLVAWQSLRGSDDRSDQPLAAAPPVDAGATAMTPPPRAMIDAGVAEPTRAGPADAGATLPAPTEPSSKKRVVKPKPRPKPDVKPKPAAAESAVPGTISIDSSPYATIYVDGRRIDDTPMMNHRLPPGRYTIRAVLEDGRSQTLTVTVRSGKPVRRTLRW